jgi:hypothetical protein
MTYTISSNLPIPPVTHKKRGKPTKYPYAAMEVNNSFDVPVAPDEDAKKVIDRMRNTSAAWAKRNAPASRFTVRAICEDGRNALVRVWRIADTETAA